MHHAHPPLGPPTSPLPVLVILEGPHDVEFLRRISRILSASEPAVPSLTALEHSGQIVLLPLGGNGPQPWLSQLTPLGRSQFLLFDRELFPQSALRRIAVARLNSFAHRRAFLTNKRSLENYLHPDAVLEAREVEMRIGADTPVAELAARRMLEAKGGQSIWDTLSSRTHKRLRDRAKKWLNRDAVDRMTPERLAERDPCGEVAGWLRTIGELVCLRN